MITITRKTADGEVTVSWPTGLNPALIEDALERACRFGSADFARGFDMGQKIATSNPRGGSKSSIVEAVQAVPGVAAVVFRHIVGAEDHDTMHHLCVVLDDPDADLHSKVMAAVDSVRPPMARIVVHFMMDSAVAREDGDRRERVVKAQRTTIADVEHIVEQYLNDEGGGELTLAERVDQLGQTMLRNRGDSTERQAAFDKLTTLVKSIDEISRGSDAEPAPLAKIRDLIAKHNAPPLTLDTATGEDLDRIARDEYGESRQPGDTDADLRNRCIPF